MELRTTIRKLTSLLLFYIVYAQAASSQGIVTGKWAWMSGDTTVNNAGIYGTKGGTSSANKPGAREDAISWTDAVGNFWLFGGFGYGASSNSRSDLNDLWKYDPATNQWTWMSGDNIVGSSGIYGTKGIAGAANKPGAREAAVSWLDAKGNLWLFGGFGYDASGNRGELNDLWKYDPAIKHWTWVSGDNIVGSSGIYGTKGVASAAYKPPARDDAISWRDMNGNFWLFGGEGYRASGGSRSYLSDLWKYDPVTNHWTWVNGDSTINNAGAYSAKGVASAANKPGARDDAISWRDINGNLWLYGGIGIGTTNSSGYLNDLWKYDPFTNQWTWVSGDNTINNIGIYGTKGVAGSANKPGARDEAISWLDATGNLWLFGGFGLGNTSGGGSLNDLWKYDPAINQWTWVSGDNTINNAGVYGTKGVADATNKPEARDDAISWTDKRGNLWLFGGVSYASNNWRFNDLWKFVPCTPPTGTISPGTTVLCLGASVRLTATGGTLYQWYKDNVLIPGAIGANYLANGAGTYTVFIYNSDCGGWASNSAVVTVKPAITFSHSTTPDKCNRANGSIIISNVSGGSSNSYLYSIDSGNNFRTDPIFINLKAGTYKVVVKDGGGAVCLSSQQSITVSQTSSDLNVTSANINPATCASVTGSAIIKAAGGTRQYWYRLNNNSFQPFVGPDSTFKLAPGSHTVTIRDSDSCESKTGFIIEKKDTLPKFEVRNPSSSCEGVTIDLTHDSLKTNADANLTFSYWTNTAATQPLNDSQAVRAAGTYYIKAVNSYGCATIKPIKVHFIGRPHTDFTIPTPNCTSTAIPFTNTTRAPDNTTLLSYTWKVNDSVVASGPSLIYMFKEAGAYSVTLIAAPANCLALADDTTKLITIESVEAGRRDTVVVESGIRSQLSGRTGNRYQYLWTPPDSLDNASSRTPTIKTSTDKTYTISITTASGCRINDVLVVQVTKPAPDSVTEVFVPTAFTPDNNGQNDVLRPRFINISELLYFKIYNRWGQLVFETNTIGKGWDGNLKGQPQPAETYSWVLVCKDAGGHIIKKGGHSILIR